MSDLKNLSWADMDEIEDEREREREREREIKKKETKPISFAAAVLKNIRNTILDDKEFPKIGDVKTNDIKTTKDDVKSKKDVNIKSRLCKQIIEGKICPYNDCNFAHYSDELKINSCTHDDTCTRIKFVKDIVRNVDNKNPCYYIHTRENVENYLRRQGGMKEEVLKNILERPKLNVLYKNTRMCFSYFDDIPCTDECTYAHKLEDLRVSQCTHQEKCHHITRNKSDQLCNNENTGVICFFLHKGEDMDNYIRRVIEKKRDMRKIEKEIKESERKIEENEKKRKIEENMIVSVKKYKVDSNENDKIIIRLRKNMAIEVMELMVASGNKNIEFQFTD